MDIDRLRSDTPGCAKVLHFNNAGSSLMPAPVYRALQDNLDYERDYGGYAAAAHAEAELASFYTEIAGLLNADRDEIAYVENATRAWDMAFYGLPLSEGDRILTHGSEYASNYLAFLHLRKRVGVEIDLVPSDAFGQIDVSRISELVTPRTKVIAITHVPTQGGLVNPAAEVGAKAREHGLIFVLDACQSVGQIDIDVRKIGCHVLAATGRKFLRGPRGTGFLYVEKELCKRIDPPFIDLHAATWLDGDSYALAEGARKFENWESFVAGRVALARAVAYAREIGLDRIETRVEAIAAQLRVALSDVPGVGVHDLGQKKCGIVTFHKDGMESTVLADRLMAQGMNVSVSYVEYARLDLGLRGTGPLVRASPHYFNTEDEVARFARAVGDMK